MHTATLPAPPAPVATPKPCPTCRRGCTCKPDLGESCSHYGCWGRNATGDCPGVVYEAERERVQRAAFARVRRNGTRYTH